jgi:starch synthase
MNVLFVSSEVAPFAKSGGLGDISASLPRHLAPLGHDVRVFLPLHRRIDSRGFEEVIPELVFQLGPHQIRVSILVTRLPGSQVPVYFVRCPSLYDRPGLYEQGPDEHLRFAVLCHAALRACQVLRFAPDIAHVNDWQTGLLPLLLKSAPFVSDPLFARTRSLLTIHNLAFQGAFEARFLGECGLAQSIPLLHQDDLRNGRLSFLTTGILHANAITTVSPTYAREIQTPDQGFGLDGLLRQRRDVLFGILNGIDEDEWSPDRDRFLRDHFSAADLSGKERNKAALLATAQLPYRREIPACQCCRACCSAAGCNCWCWGRGRSDTRISSRAWCARSRSRWRSGRRSTRASPTASRPAPICS